MAKSTLKGNTLRIQELQVAHRFVISTGTGDCKVGGNLNEITEKLVYQA